MRKFNILLILTIALVLFGFSMAEAISNAGALFLRVAPGARPGGMGEAFISIADDASATYWNPAGLGNAPISGMLKTYRLPQDMAPLSAATLLEKEDGGFEIWAISGSEIVKFDGKSWVTGEDFYTSSDQTLEDVIRSNVSVGSDVDISPMIAAVVAANCPITEDEVEAFVSKVAEATPEGYKELELLVKGLEALTTGFGAGRLNADLFQNLQKKLTDGLKDGSLSGEELDRLTFSLEQAVYRFLPSRMMIPYSASVTGTPRAMVAARRYLWVATENGLYRRSGTSWAHFSGVEKIPSDNVLSLATNGTEILIGTDQGVAKYARGEFSTWSGAEFLKGEVTALAFSTQFLGCAIVDGYMYSFDGASWKQGYRYTVRIDDNMESLIERTGIYHTASEKKVLHDRILNLNSIAPETSSDWLVEGNEILLPISPPIRFGVNAIAISPTSVFWIGTGSGLLSYDNGQWARHGFDEFIVPQPSDEGQPVFYTAETIARDYYPGGDSGMVSLLAANIDNYNELNGNQGEPGQKIYVYSQNVGAAIHSIDIILGDLHVGTDHGLEQLTPEGWQEVDAENLDNRLVHGSFEIHGTMLYVASDGVTMETRGKREFILMHANWLPTLGLDMYYEFVTYVHHIRGLGSFGFNFIYLNYGAINFRDENGVDLGTFSPYEMAITVSYGTSLSRRLKAGINGKFIHSRLSNQGVGQEMGTGITSTFAVDFGMLYKITNRVQFGAVISNLGPDITYIDQAQSDPLPRNFGVGISAKVFESEYNSLLIQGELNKLLVELDDGNVRELETAIRHIGAEYWYSNFMALRAGYKYDKEGFVKHLTFGAGLQLKAFRLDFAYIPSSDESPLANTIRVSLTGTF